MEPVIIAETDHPEEVDIDPWRAMPLFHGAHPASDAHGEVPPAR